MEQLYVHNGRSRKPYVVTSGDGMMHLGSTGLNIFRDVKLTGGSIAGVPLLVAPEAGNRLYLFDANAFGYFDAGLDVLNSENAAIQMSDAPTAAAASVVSGFQVGMVVVRFVRHIHWVKLRDDAAGFIELDFAGSPA